MKAAVLGTSGYTGLELVRLLASHSQISDIIAVSSSQAGVSLTDLDPGLSGDPDIAKRTRITGGKLATIERAAELEPEVVFAALPHLKSAEVCDPFFDTTVVIDLSADFRISEVDAFEHAYGQSPPRADLLSRAVYGLTEWTREPLRKTNLIANPGCYPTCTSLPLIPLLRDGVVEPDFWTTALSGISGAGRSAKRNFLYVERSENMNAYAPGHRHRHIPEIIQNLCRFGTTGSPIDPEAISLFFVPHLVPVQRGMFVTTRIRLADGCDAGDLRRSLERAYADEPFVNLLGERIPETRHVRGTNRCDIGWHFEDSQVALFSTIDNLLKGASGQALQNMNVRFGFDEQDGLLLRGSF